MKKSINVLSLFDGMSCGRQALERLGIPVNIYMASEVDKYAIQITQKNYPDTVQLGGVCKVTKVGMPKIDLLLAGSPCQGFSFAGKQLAFDDPRSILFFEFVRILKECKSENPEIKFLLENVKMKKEYQDIITEILGVEPIEINSALVSAQNRRRLYWTNIEGVEQPEDTGTLLKDIVLSEEEKYNHVHMSAGTTVRFMGYGVPFATLNTKKARCLCAEEYVKNGRQGNYYICSTDPIISRKFHPIECERLQTVKDNYTEGVSNTQRYKMLGNGWTIDVIKHILSYANF